MGMRHRVIPAILGILVASTAGAAVLLQAVVPNLVLYLPFDEGSGTVANDQSGNNLDGALQTGTQFSTQVPAVPTGNPASLEIPNAATSPGRVVVNHDPALSITGPFTLAAWVRPTAHTANQGGLIEKWDYPSTISGYFLRLGRRASGLYPKFSIGNGGATQPEIAEYVDLPINGAWTHLAAVYDGTNMSLYRGGNLVAGPTAAGLAPGASTAPLHIGSDYGANRFQGQIDEVRVFNIALSGAQIGVLVNGMAAPTLTSLVSPAGNTLQLTWTSVPGATGYTILRGTAPGVLSPIGTAGPLETSYTDTTVAYPTRYYYAVVANGIMTSGRSNELNEVPMPDLPRFNDHEEGFKDRHCGCGTAAAPSSGLAALAVLAALAWLLARRAA